jgi:GH15 family glucan-1,4-alpha-glucosidase
MTTPLSNVGAQNLPVDRRVGTQPNLASKPAPALTGDSFKRGQAKVGAPAPGPLAAPQVTGNGFGFAVFDPAIGGVSKFFVHPYRFERANPKDARAEGIETANVLSHLAWTPATKGSGVSYLDQSEVLTTTGKPGTASYMMPFGLKRPVLVTTLQTQPGAPEPALALGWSQRVTAKQQISVGGRPAWVVSLAGVKETLVVVPLAGMGTPRFGAKLTGATGWAIASVEDPRQARAAVADVLRWQANTPPAQLPQREAAELDQWRVAQPKTLATDGERKLWRQSETVLRMGQIREANGPQRHANGLILASLPPGEWFIPWVRDMTFSTVALARMGHQDEARAALDGMLNARGLDKNLAPGDKPYQISTVRYYGDGTEEADFSDKPDRNIEFDSWGLALWASGEYFTKFQDKAWLDKPTYRGTTYTEMRDFVVAPLLDQTEAFGGGLIVKKDSSIWEQNDDVRKHYAFSTLMAIAGLNGFLDMAKAKGDQPTVTQVSAKIALLQKGFEAAFVKDGQLRGTLESSPRNDMDGALLEALNMGVVKDPKLIASTLDRIGELMSPAGGYRRVNGASGYERQEFVFTDLSIARALRAQGRETEALAIEKRLTDKANAQNGQIPEMYQAEQAEDFDAPLEAPSGAIPMVGYGAGAYVMNMTSREPKKLGDLPK